MSQAHIDANRLMAVFNQTIGKQYRTLLLRAGLEGDAYEPLYVPADEYCPYHRIYFAHGFSSSAFHELAHWCQAGEARRQLLDFGYWYEPEGRSAEKQAEFEIVEAKPQALEWILCRAAGQPFDVSADNHAIEVDRPAFRRKVLAEVQGYFARGVPARTWALVEVLAQSFGQDLPKCEDFTLGNDGRVYSGTHH